MEGGGQMSSEESSRLQGGEAVRSRWTPKPEQILILESIFNSGMVNPPKDETVRIRKLLQRFGPVADANVFYWFQNRRSRSRRRQRQLAQQQAQQAQSPASLSQSALGTTTMAAQGGGYSSSSSSSSTWPPSSPPSVGMMMDGGDDLFAISRQMGYGGADGSGSSSSAPAAAAMAHEQSQMYYSYQQQAAGGMNNTMMVYINGVATEVPRGPVDVRSMFGDDAVLVHAAGGLLPVDDYGVLVHSLQMGESYFWSRGQLNLIVITSRGLS